MWEGFLARGALTMLAGRPFVGKSMLIGGLLRALEDGASFLGQKTMRSSALLVTEEHEVTLRPRAVQLGLTALKSEFVGRSGGVFSVEWPKLVAAATEHALKRGHSLLVVDTFSTLAGLKAEEENDAGAISERLRPLQEAAGEGLSVLFLHHLNKQGQVRGSTAFKGIADISIRMQRELTKSDFRLSIESRFSAPMTLEARLVASRAGTAYVPLKSSRAANKRPQSTDDRLLEALRAAGPAGLTYAEIDKTPGLSEDIAKKRFSQWYPRRIGRTGGGTKGNPYRWFVNE